jgi:hypothetical protein
MNTEVMERQVTETSTPRQWKNLLIDKSGNSFRCLRTFPTEAEAKLAWDKGEAERASEPNRFIITTMDGCVFGVDVACGIQIPWG